MGVVRWIRLDHLTLSWQEPRPRGYYVARPEVAHLLFPAEVQCCEDLLQLGLGLEADNGFQSGPEVPAQ